jgi:PAS domain S-box-containing protein
LKLSHRWLVLSLIAFLGLLMSAALVVFARTESDLLFSAVPNEDASIMIKHELAEFHILLEKRIIGYGQQDDEALWGHFDRAEWLANAMVEGGNDGEWNYVPVDDQTLRLKAYRLKGVLAELRTRAKALLANDTGTPGMRVAEKEFDAQLGVAQTYADDTEKALRLSVTKLERRHDSIVNGIILLCIMFTAGTVSITYRYMAARRRAEDRLSSMHAFLQEVMDGVAESIMVVDRDYNIMMMNAAAAKISGCGEPSVGGKCHELTHSKTEPCEKAGLPCPLGKVLESGRPVIVEHEHIRADGTKCAMEILASPWRDEKGEIKGIIQTSRDITERKRMEREKADFYAMVTHDIKSPLTAILGYADLILNDTDTANPDERTRDILGHIVKSGQNVLRLVGDFLSVSQLETSSLTPDLFPCDISGILGEVIDELRKGFEDKGLILDVNIPEGLPKGILLDQKLVSRAVENLLANAVNYTLRGGTVTLEARQETVDDKSFITIAVSDTGPGIPALERERIFDRYYRSKKSKGVKGTGLGLAIVKAVAEVHGGSVRLQSEEGSGSTFVLRLPAGQGLSRG